MVNLSVLEQRLQHRLPSNFAEDIAEEINKFTIEMERVSEREESVGQATLTEEEIKRLNTTNQYGKDGLTTIQWQSVKAKALKNGFVGWTRKVDGKLSYEENMSLMERKNGY